MSYLFSRIRFISSTAYELRFDPFADKKTLYSSEDSYAAPPEIRGKPSHLKVTVKEANGILTITAGRIKLDVNKVSFAIKVRPFKQVTTTSALNIPLTLILMIVRHQHYPV
jgi:hypothetical protein